MRVGYLNQKQQQMLKNAMDAVKIGDVKSLVY